MLNLIKKNVVFFFIFALLFSFFLVFWNNSFFIDKKKLNSLEYELIIKKINSKNSEKLPEIEKFIIKNENIYGTLTAMFLAKKYVFLNDLDRAFVQLKNSLKYTKDENLKNILKLRMTKIKMQKSQSQEAINILKTIKNKNWENIIENMKGDIFIKEKNIKKAIFHWKKCLFFEKLNASKEIINMKINEIK